MSNTENLQKQDGFKSKWGFIMACIGSAVGMANIWRFPNMVSTYGGMTFLLPYFLFVLLIGSSGVIEEFALGRWAGAGPVGAFGKCTEERTGGRRLGEYIGALPIIGSMGLAIGYSVVMGWIFKYTAMAFTGELYAMGQDMAVIGGTFDVVAVDNAPWVIVAVAVSFLIMSLGVAGGIELSCKFMMPILFGLFLVLAVYIAFLSGAVDGYQYIFTLNPAGLANPKVWIYAFGQAFFSLSVAGNGSVIYGSYLPKNEDLPSSARNVALFDTIAALLAMIVILPAMSVGGMEPSAGGPGLMFVYLPNVLNGMPGGRIVGIVFFVAVLFAGLSSIVNLYEAPVAFLQEKFHLGRIPSVVIIGAIGAVISVMIQPWTSQWMDLVSVFICPLGAVLAGVMFFWILKKSTAMDAVNAGRTAGKKAIDSWFYPLGKYGYCLLALIALVGGAAYFLITGSSIG